MKDKGDICEAGILPGQGGGELHKDSLELGLKYK